MTSRNSLLPAVLIAGILIGGTVLQQYGSQLNQGISNAVPRVNVDVVVADRDGYSVQDLRSDDFKIFDDNVQQPITNFSFSDAPKTVAFLLGEPRRPAFQLTSNLIPMICPDNWCGLFIYSRDIDILADFTRDTAELGNSLNDWPIPRSLDSRLYTALYGMLDRVEQLDSRRAVVLLSSGLDIGEFTEHTYLELLKRTESLSYPIYTISTAHLGVALIDTTTTGGGITGTRVLQADNAMRSFAENSGGSAFVPRFVEDFPSLLNALSSQLRYAYRVTFIPSNHKPDGKFHKLRVEVDAHGKADKLQIHHKRGYYAPNR